jgi:hypothetical protein
LQIGVLLVCVVGLLEVVALNHCYSAKEIVMGMLGMHLQGGYGWAVTQAISIAFCAYLQASVEITLTFAYVGSFYRLKEFFSGKRVPLPRYLTIIKYILLVYLVVSCTVSCTSQIAVTSILWAGE